MLKCMDTAVCCTRVSRMSCGLCDFVWLLAFEEAQQPIASAQRGFSLLLALIVIMIIRFCIYINEKGIYAYISLADGQEKHFLTS